MIEAAHVLWSLLNWSLFDVATSAMHGTMTLPPICN